MKYIAVMLALLLAGCAPAIDPGASMMQRAALPTELVAANPAVVPGRKELPVAAWWQEFHEPGLDRLLDIALAGNPGLLEAAARLKSAQATVMRTQSLTGLHVDSQLNIQRQELSKNGNHDIYNGKTATIANLDPLAVSYHLDFWHRDAEIIAASHSAEQLTRAQYRQAALMLSSAVIKTYFALQTARQLASAEAEIVARATEKLRLQNEAVQAGISPTSVGIIQNRDLIDAQNALTALKKSNKSLTFALLELLGKEPADLLTAEPAALPEPRRFKIPARIGLDAVAQRPDIQAALWNVRRQSHLVKVAQAAYYPNIDLFAIGGLNSIGLTKLLGPGSTTYAFGPALDLPIFESGALEGQFHENEAEYDAAVHAYNRILLAALRQIADALSGLQYSRTQLDDTKAMLALRVRQADIAESGFRAGVTGKLPYLDAEIGICREKMLNMEQNLDWLNSITDTATALGGGFARWPA